MKTLRKMDLDSMQREFQVLQNPEKVLGGDGIGGFVSSINIVGGTITNWNYNGDTYAVFNGSDGKCLVLDGVNVGHDTLPLQQDDTACYFGGKIRIGGAWTNFNIQDLLHEYGHYLQAQSSVGSITSSLSYSANVICSAIDMAFNDPDHMNMPFEQDATNRGNAYGASNYGFPKSY